MHKWAKEIMECVKAKVSSKGLDNIEASEVEEFKCWAEIAKNIAELDYYYKIIDKMEESEKNGENGENERYFYQPRNSMGQYSSRRRSYDEMYDPMMRRGLDEVYYTPTMRRGMEEARDMDVNNGKMYYAGMTNRYYDSNSRYERAKRGFEEAKAVEPGAEHMKEIEKMMDALEAEMKEIKPKMTANEKALAKNKLTTLSTTLV